MIGLGGASFTHPRQTNHAVAEIVEMNTFATKMPLSSRHGFGKIVALQRRSLPELMRRACAYHRRGGMIFLDVPSLVHEICLRLSAAGVITPMPRKKFLGNASRAVRAAILDYPNERIALKRGGSAAAFPLMPSREGADFHEDSSCALSDAFKALVWIEARSHTLIKMHYRGGMDDEENPDLYDSSVTTAKRDWREAHAFQFDIVAKAAP